MTTLVPAFLIALALGMSGCSTAVAQTASGSSTSYVTDLARPAYKACVRSANGRIEQASCIQEEQAYQNQRLDQAYEKLLDVVNKVQRTALEKSQTDWRAFVDSDLRFAVALLDPMQLDMLVSENQILLTVQRRQILEHTIYLIGFNDDGKMD